MSASLTEPQYSIIVPVYNVENYLAECIDSLLAQDTAEDYEVILVDDGSTDSSGAICDAYAARDARVRVFHQKNSGVSAARNAGIRAAAGRFVCFCDSDDRYLPAYLHTMETAMSGCAPDMVQVCGQQFDETGLRETICPVIQPVAEGEVGQVYLARCLAADTLPLYGSYYYCYRREWLLEKRLFFPEYLGVNEDLDFILRCIPAARSVCGTKAVVYLYRQHIASIVHTPNPTKTKMRMETSAKWFQTYPSGVLADLFILSAVQLSTHGSRKEVKGLVELCRMNKKCWRYAKDWRSRLAVVLFRLFGVYNGSALFQWMIAVKQSLFHRCG